LSAAPSFPIVVFLLDGRRYGLALTAVEQVIRLVDITPLPRAPAIVAGVINLHGAALPVIDLRRRFDLPARAPETSDQLICARTRRRRIMLLVDTVSGVEEGGPRDWIDGGTVLPGLEYVSGVVKRADGLILIHDLDTCLSLEEGQALDRAMTSREEA
jgi:purine-binding chemotaxis protein CheW